VTTPGPETFDDLCGSLPDHATEVMTSHRGQPGLQEQDRTHGTGRPAVDNGLSEEQKYGGTAA
jgi:hypothetical protein